MNVAIESAPWDYEKNVYRDLVEHMWKTYSNVVEMLSILTKCDTQICKLVQGKLHNRQVSSLMPQKPYCTTRRPGAKYYKCNCSNSEQWDGF